MAVVVAYLLGCVVAGYGITYWCGVSLRTEERLVFGMVLGPMAATLGTFGLGAAIGLGRPAILAGLGVALALGVLGVGFRRPLLVAELGDLKSRWLGPLRSPGHPWPLVILILACWPYTIRVLRQAYVRTPKGLFAGHLSSWADWSAHLSYAGAFAYGRELPTDLPIAAGHKFGYHFMVDLFAANLTRLGISLPSGLVVSSLVLALAFPLVMYVVALRLVGGRLAAFLSVLIFLLGGGLGFVYFFVDLDTSGLRVLHHLPRDYSALWNENYWMGNPVLSYLYPQRPTLFGFSLVLIAAAILWSARGSSRLAPFLFAGVIVGLTPLFHSLAFLTAFAMAVCWALLDRRRAWLAFLAPALLLSIPAIVWLAPAHSFVRVQLGWMASTGRHHDNVVWFWLKNTGVFIPLLLVAQFRRGTVAPGFAKFFAPLWLWFLVPNVLVFHPWEWDNTHYFAFWLLFGSMMVGALVARMFRSGPDAIVLGALCLAVLTFSGLLAIARAGDFQTSNAQLTTTDGIHAADWARTHTPSDAVFVVAPVNTQPVMSLGAREVVVGYPGWVWDLGLPDWSRRTQDVGRILRGEASASALVRRYRVRYVVIGPLERDAPLLANQQYWDDRARLAYRNAEYRIYEVAL
jgi:hypothetical protein